MACDMWYDMTWHDMILSFAGTQALSHDEKMV